MLSASGIPIPASRCVRLVIACSLILLILTITQAPTDACYNGTGGPVLVAARG